MTTKPVITWLMDQNLRGSNVETYQLGQGPLWSEITIPQSLAYGDTIGYPLFSLFGDYYATGTASTPTWTTSGALSAGATSIAVTSGSSAVAATFIQVDSTAGDSEIVTVGTGSTATNIVLSASTPLRFNHLTGITITTVIAPFCVDEETEILTADGWKTVHDLRAGEDVLTYNHETGLSEWQAAQEVCIFPAAKRELVSMEGRGHSSLTTPNHRWPALDRKGGRVWATTETLQLGHRIPVGAMCADLPTDPKYTDAFVELVAWAWTEGHIRGTNSIVICQSLKHAENIDRIDAAMRAVLGAPSENLGKRNPEPRWWRYLDGSNVRFNMNAAAARSILDVAPGRVVRREFLRTLTQAQLDLFIKVSMLADNCGPTRLAQKNRAAAEAFQFAAILAGYATSLIERVLKPRESVPVTLDGRYSMWGVTLQSRKWMTPIDSARMAEKYGSGWSISRVEHDGIVWCPRTPNMTWLDAHILEPEPELLHGKCERPAAVVHDQPPHPDPRLRQLLRRPVPLLPHH